MKKIIKLTESKLIELIENIVAEQQSGKMIPKPTTNKFLPPPMSNEPELTKPEPGPETYEEAKELNAFNEKILDLKNRGLMSPEQFMLQYNMKNGSRPIKTPNDKIIPYVTTDKFMPPAMSKEPEVTKPEPEELDSLQESINKIVKRFKKTISEQEIGGYKEGPGEKQTPEFDHYNKIVKPKLLAAGFKDAFDKRMIPYGTENTMTYGGHNNGINVLWNKPKDGKGWEYVVWMGDNKGLRKFPIGGSDQNTMKAANSAVNYALMLKKSMSGGSTNFQGGLRQVNEQVSKLRGVEKGYYTGLSSVTGKEYFIRVLYQNDGLRSGVGAVIPKAGPFDQYGMYKGKEDNVDLYYNEKDNTFVTGDDFKKKYGVFKLLSFFR